MSSMNVKSFQTDKRTELWHRRTGSMYFTKSVKGNKHIFEEIFSLCNNTYKNYAAS